MSEQNPEVPSHTVELSPEEELAAAFHTPEEGAESAEEQTSEVAVEATPEASVTKPAEERAVEASKNFMPFTVVHNGKEIPISTIEEAREYAQKGFDYSAKTMSLADEKKAIRQLAETIKAREEQRQADLRAFLSDREKVRAYLQALETSQGVSSEPPAHTQPAFSQSEDEFEPVSRQELERVRQAAIEEAERKAKESMVEALEKVEIARMQADFSTDFGRHLHSLISTTYPSLADVEGIDELIMRDGQRFFEAQMELTPGRAIDPKAIKHVMTESAKRRAEKLEARTRTREKETAVRQQTLTTKGPEPRGGSAPGQSAAKELDLKSDELAKAVLEDIQALMGR